MSEVTEIFMNLKLSYFFSLSYPLLTLIVPNISLSATSYKTVYAPFNPNGDAAVCSVIEGEYRIRHALLSALNYFLSSKIV